MFIAEYKLDKNPFAEDSVRPLFVSQAMRKASAAVRQVAEGAIQSLYISGVSGVGKTTLLRQRMRSFKELAHSWVGPEINTSEKLVKQLLHDVGPGFVEGSKTELRNILDVYLTHQRGNERLSLVVADGLERQSAEVMRELESLGQLRAKRLPALQFVLLTRNDDLAEEMATQHEQNHFLRAVHQRLAGFSVEETMSYIRACLLGAGNDRAEELIPQEVVFDIQAFTQGVVGDVNTLCCAALEALREQHGASIVKPQPIAVTSELLKGVAARLHLRHEPEALLNPKAERLSPSAVHVSDSWNLKIEAARLIVSSQGQQLAEVTLNRPRMVLGRDSACDISLDSNYLSRYQNLFMETKEGWMLIDLNSTNGCYVNGRRVHEHRLKDGDLIAVGYHQLRFSAPRPRELPEKPAPAEKTVVIDSEEKKSRSVWGV